MWSCPAACRSCAPSSNRAAFLSCTRPLPRFHSFFSTLFMRAAKLHSAFGGGSMTLLPLVPGRPATGGMAEKGFFLICMVFCALLSVVIIWWDEKMPRRGVALLTAGHAPDHQTTSFALVRHGSPRAGLPEPTDPIHPTRPHVYNSPHLCPPLCFSNPAGVKKTVDLSKYTTLSEEQKAKMLAALEARAALEAAAEVAAAGELDTEAVEEFISISDGQVGWAMERALWG